VEWTEKGRQSTVATERKAGIERSQGDATGVDPPRGHLNLLSKRLKTYISPTSKYVEQGCSTTNAEKKEEGGPREINSREKKKNN